MKGKQILFAAWIILNGARLHAQNNPDVINYINTYKALAINEMQRTGVPASITLAQGIHESEAGNSDLVKRSNNHFGIKCKDEWTGDRVYHDDDARGECFRSYPTAAESYRDHSDFLKKGSRYAFLFNLDPADYEAWANGLRKAGYATNVRYSQILIKYIQDYNLNQYSLIAMGKIKPSDEVVLTVPGSPAQPLTAMNQGPAVVVTPGAGGAVVQPAGTGPQKSYPEGEFQINRTRVVFVKAGTSLLAVANQYELQLARLLEFNDLKEEDVVVKDQLLFLQRKRRTGAVEFHIVQEGESLYDICQAEGVRFQDLLEMNQMTSDGQPAAGEKIYLQSSAPTRPVITKTVN
ncbi:MAG TPA: glucosaminidase domain-containing protein [Puia sp.]|nr:glucosaminidase domain-containing protein [Puia sp.]